MPTIQDVSKQFNVPASSIRFYERKGFLKIPRDNNGNRVFDEESLTRLELVLHYRTAGVSLQDIHEIFDSYENHQLSVKLLRKTALELDEKILELQKTREFLTNKIALHEKLAQQESEKFKNEQQRTNSTTDL